MTFEQLSACTKKVLARMARDKGIQGWHEMRKEQLIHVLATPDSSRKNQKSSKPTPASTSPNRDRQAAAFPERTPAPLRPKFSVGAAPKDLAARAPRDLPQGYSRDRIVVMVRDPYWLHCYWELTRTTIQRAEAAMAQEWHGARPILRLLDVSSDDTTSNAEAVVRDIDIHGGVNNWYIDVLDPPRSYRVDIGYLSRRGKFYVLARSNVVTTPKAGVSDAIDENWTSVQAQCEKIYALSNGVNGGPGSLELKELFEERLRRPMGAPSITGFGSGAIPQRQRRFWFQLDAELIVYGATEPGSHVTLQGEPISLRPDGTFTVRFSMPDSRQIIPAVAASADGVEERTIVLAVERNTKELEPMIHDGNEG